MKLKTFLESIGFKVFLAHNDLKPSDEWQKEIVKHLNSCKIFMPLLTKKFLESDWTDQETGMAYIKNKMVMPLSVYVMPYGFIAKYQCYRLKPRNLQKSCLGIVKGFEQKSKSIRDHVCGSIIKEFIASRNFNDTSLYSELLLEFDHLSRAELYRVFSGARSNDQVYKYYNSIKFLRQLREKHSHFVSNRLWRSFEVKWQQHIRP